MSVILWLRLGVDVGNVLCLKSTVYSLLLKCQENHIKCANRTNYIIILILCSVLSFVHSKLIIVDITVWQQWQKVLQVGTYPFSVEASWLLPGQQDGTHPLRIVIVKASGLLPGQQPHTPYSHSLNCTESHLWGSLFFIFHLTSISLIM